MASRPDGSLPKQHGDWADLKAAYRFYNNPKVTPVALRAEHLHHVQTACAQRATILCVQDGSELDYSSHNTVQGLGFVGDGRGRGLLQHSSLAVTTEGSVLGVTSEPVEDLDQANTGVTWYTFRWRIEEWHKAVKSGCRLEAAQFETAEAIERLATMVGIVAVRMLQLRDAAQTTLATSEIDDASPSEQPHVLQAMAPWEWIVVVSGLARCTPESLTPRLFWRTIACRGGFIGRKSDGHPGWQTIWRGWSEIAIRVEAFEAASAHLRTRKSCG